MKSKLKEVLTQVRSGRAAELSLEANEQSYIRRFQPRERLILLGGGHIALHTCTLASRLGFAVTVVDDRAAFASPQRFPDAEAVLCQDFAPAIAQLAPGPGDFVAVMTRGHRSDGACLRALLSLPEPTRYLGMVSSRKRGIEMRRALEAEGFDPARLSELHSPIGLPINAITLEEIAVSIVAELVQVRRADTPRRSHSTILTQTDPEQDVLEFAVEDPEPKALVVVLETRGSTPVKPGALLAVDRSLRIAGTIGGGCAESACMRQAWRLIGTGTQRTLTVSLNEDDAQDQGMACGGEMLVLAADVC